MEDKIKHIKNLPIPCEERLYLLSLAYQINNDYDEELALLSHASIENDYLKERLNWHNLPNLQKYEKRPPLYTKRTPDFDPVILNELCFVSAADSNYFEFLSECIESIKNTVVYKDIPFFILDCGLEEWQKDVLSKTVIKIVDPGWDIDTGRYVKQGWKAMTARPFLPKHFPGFRYYFWIDADAWVQDEGSIDRYINLCLKENIGISSAHENVNFDFMINLPHVLYTVAQPYTTLDYSTTAYINSGIFCIDAQTGIFETWQNILAQNIRKKSIHHISEQNSLNITLHLKKPNFRPLNLCNNYSPLPVLHTADDNKLFTIGTNELAGFIHLVFLAKKHARSEIVLRQDTTIAEETLGRFLLDHSARYKAYNASEPSIFNFVKTTTTFRTFPWKNKEKIREIFDNNYNDVLNKYNLNN